MDELTEQPPSFAFQLWTAFVIWMLIDAWRRRAPVFWYFIIMLPPGALFYFIVVKLRDFHYSDAPMSERAVAEEPSIAPIRASALPASLDDADRLEDEGQYAEAEPIYREVLAAHPKHPRALFGLGNCRLGSGNALESLPYFEQVLELDRSYANYGAALNYADALWEANQRNDCIELLERLADVTGRTNHRLALAHYLVEMGNTDRAKRELERAIAEGQGPTAPYSERQARWVETARQMLAELSQPQDPAPPGDDE